MRVAVTFEDGHVFQHFGHTEHFMIYEIHDGQIMEEWMLDTLGTGHEGLAHLLRRENVDALICGGLGEGARMALASVGIAVYAGVLGPVDLAIHDFVAGRLVYTDRANCSHHGAHAAHGNHAHHEHLQNDPHGPHIGQRGPHNSA